VIAPFGRDDRALAVAALLEDALQRQARIRNVSSSLASA
jgi:hypothetical protein